MDAAAVRSLDDAARAGTICRLRCTEPIPRVHTAHAHAADFSTYVHTSSLLEPHEDVVCTMPLFNCRYGVALANEILPQYPVSRFASPFWADAQIIGDAMVSALRPNGSISPCICNRCHNYRTCLCAFLYNIAPQMTCPARQSAKWIVDSRANLTNPAPMYVYFFNHTLEVVQVRAAPTACRTRLWRCSVVIAVRTRCVE